VHEGATLRVATIRRGQVRLLAAGYAA